jgi:hypothetical protein
MPATYWTQKGEDGGYEMVQGTRQKDTGEWINTRAVPVHRITAVAWYGLDSVSEQDVHHRLPIPWLNVESNLLPLPKSEHAIITQYQERKGCTDSVVSDVTGEL